MPGVNMGETEVEQLDTGLCDQNVRGLQIPMRDAFSVRRVKGIADLSGAAQNLIQRHGAFQRDPFDVLHHQIVRTNVIERADVGMIQRGHGAGFLFKARAELFRGSLDGNDAVQTRVASAINLAHPAFADEFENLVGSQPGAGCQHHGAELYNED